MVTLIFTICTGLVCVDLPAPYYVPTMPTQCAVDGMYQKLLWDEEHPSEKIEAWACIKVK